jgi:hypothetical protein
VSITEGNLVSTVIDHERRLGNVENKQADVEVRAAKLARDADQRMRLLYTILAGVGVGLFLNVIEHLAHW